MALAKLYEDSGRYDDAEAQYNKASEVKPNDPTVLAGMAGYYNRQGDFPKTIDALEKAAALEPNNPEGYHRVAIFYWDKAEQDLPPVGRREEGLHHEGARDGGQGAQPQPRLHGSDDLQEHPPPHAGATPRRIRRSRSELIDEADKLRNKVIDAQKRKQTGKG